MPKTLPPEKHAEILAALHINPNARATARKVGVSEATVRGKARKAGIELTAGKKAASSAANAERMRKKRADPEFNAKREAGLARAFAAKFAAIHKPK